MKKIKSVLVLLFMINFITCLHELGHFSAARYFDVQVKEFSVGFGTELLSVKDNSNSKYVFRLLPIGGYVDLNQEQLNNASPMQRVLIFASGVAMNTLLAFVLLLYAVSVLPKFRESEGSVLTKSLKLMSDWLKMFFSFEVQKKGIEEKGAILKINTAISKNLSNFGALAGVASVMSFMIGLLNILPAPPLDGGKVMFVAIEMLKGSPLSDGVQDITTRVGAGLVMALFVWTTHNGFKKPKE